MKIIHIGGISKLVEPLTQAQRADGHEVEWVAPQGEWHVERSAGPGIPSVESVLADPPNICHLHVYEQPTGWSAEDTLRLEGSKVRVVYSVYGSRPIDVGKSHTFLANPEGFTGTSTLPNWSWLPYGVDLGCVAAPKPREPSNKDDLRILHIPLCPEQMGAATITQTIEALQAKGRRIAYQMFIPEPLEPRDLLLRTIQQCDLFIEQVGRESYGVLGLYAMLCGKTVVSGNAPGLKKHWQQLEFCPVQDVSDGRLLERIETILREPKCMRDFGKRSRQYVETYHDVRKVAALTVQKYKQLQ